jgi:hypothetical protein
MKKLNGSDVITIIKASKNHSVLDEAKTLSPDDFNQDDIIVKTFFASFAEGFKSNKYASSNTDDLAKEFNLLKGEIVTYGLRKAHNLIQNARAEDNDAVKLENSTIDTHFTNSFESQFKAAQIVNFLSKYIDGIDKKKVLGEAYKFIMKNDLENASDSIREVFSGAKRNTRTAFVTLKNQEGEAYQLCPKGIYIWGSPRPMAISNCREYCIDAKLHPDGTVSCNYLKWLNDTMITHKQALNIGDRMDYNDGKTEIEYMELPKGVRTKFPMSDQDPQDSKINRKIKSNTEESWESQLEKEHKKFDSDKKDQSKEKKTHIISDAAIELLLNDVREAFDEEDLDTLEIEIRKAMGE